jgi:hypothetical protein
LLGKPLGKLRGRRDSCLERRPSLARERPVRERGELGDLPTAGLLTSTASHYGNANSESTERTHRMPTP